MQLLVRNRVADFATWLEVFLADAEPATAYGLKVTRLWRSADDPNNVFFLMDVDDVDRANAFMARPESRAAGEKSGVIDGEFYFVDPVDV